MVPSVLVLPLSLSRSVTCSGRKVGPDALLPPPSSSFLIFCLLLAGLLVEPMCLSLTLSHSLTHTHTRCRIFSVYPSEYTHSSEERHLLEITKYIARQTNATPLLQKRPRLELIYYRVPEAICAVHHMRPVEDASRMSVTPQTLTGLPGPAAPRREDPIAPLWPLHRLSHASN